MVAIVAKESPTARRADASGRAVAIVRHDAGRRGSARLLRRQCERPVSAWSAPAVVLVLPATSTRARIVTARIGAATLRYREAAAGIGTVADPGGAERDRAHSRDVARASTTDSRLGDTLCRRLMIGAHRRHGLGEFRGNPNRLPAHAGHPAPGAVAGGSATSERSRSTGPNASCTRSWIAPRPIGSQPSDRTLTRGVPRLGPASPASVSRRRLISPRNAISA